MRDIIRPFLLRLAAAALGIALLSGCARQSQAPLPPTTAQLERLIARASNLSPDAYSQYGVSFDRFVSATQWPATINQCALEYGVTSADASTPNPTGRAALRGTTQLVFIRCSLRYPDASLEPKLKTDEQWKVQYLYLRNFLAPCLRSVGAIYHPPLSERFFLVEAHRFELADPFDSVSTGRSGLRSTALRQLCPPTAPSQTG